MKTKIIYGEQLTNKIYADIKSDIVSFKTMYNKIPGIAFVGFHDVPLGKYNIPYHIKTAKQLGFQVYTKILAEETTEEQLFDAIEILNNDDNVNCIEILQPLPPHLNPLRIMSKVQPEKEMEGFHPVNMNKSLMPDIYEGEFTMCLPAALKMLFYENDVVVNHGEHWVLLIDNEFLKNPLVNLVTRTAFMKSVPDYCSQTIVNYDDPNMIAHCKRADYLVVVTKKALCVKPAWLKEGVCIIDIYSNLVKEVSSKTDPLRKVPIIRGGVDIESVNNIAGTIIPIPGGLMGVVLAILLKNTVNAIQNALKVNDSSVV